MTPKERADALVTVESSEGGNYHDVTFAGCLRLTTFYAGHGDERGEKAKESAEIYRAAIAGVLAKQLEQAVDAQLREEKIAYGELLSVTLDLWRWATGEEFRQMTEEDAASEGETLLALHRKVRDARRYDAQLRGGGSS